NGNGNTSTFGAIALPAIINWLLLFWNWMYVTLAPSGDHDGELRRAPAGAVTSVVLLPAMSIDSIRAPAELVPLTKAMFFPSADHAGSNTSRLLSKVLCVKAPVATSTVEMSKLPLNARSDENAIVEPSGDTRGSRSAA